MLFVKHLLCLLLWCSSKLRIFGSVLPLICSELYFLFILPVPICFLYRCTNTALFYKAIQTTSSNSCVFLSLRTCIDVCMLLPGVSPNLLQWCTTVIRDSQRCVLSEGSPRVLLFESYTYLCLMGYLCHSNRTFSNTSIKINGRKPYKTLLKSWIKK